MDMISLQYVHLLAWIAYFKHRVVLNKTQMQKLLFMCYGQALAMDGGRLLFRDDIPRAWPFGPVFPQSYQWYEERIPGDLTDEEKRRFATEPNILRMISRTVAEYCHISATRLSYWSHRKGSPWQQTVFSGPSPEWNREIQQDVIRNYFSNPDWRIGI